MEIDTEFLEEYGDMISKYLWSMKLSGRDEYDNLYNDVVIKLIENKEKYDAERAAVSTWITWTMRTVCHNYFRHKQQDATHNAVPLANEMVPSSQDPANTEDLVSMIHNAEGLVTKEKMMLLQYYHEGYTHYEVGKLNIMTEGAAKTYIHRAKAKLNEHIQGELNA